METERSLVFYYIIENKNKIIENRYLLYKDIFKIILKQDKLSPKVERKSERKKEIDEEPAISQVL